MKNEKMDTGKDKLRRVIITCLAFASIGIFFIMPIINADVAHEAGGVLGFRNVTLFQIASGEIAGLGGAAFPIIYGMLLPPIAIIISLVLHTKALVITSTFNIGSLVAFVTLLPGVINAELIEQGARLDRLSLSPWFWLIVVASWAISHLMMLQTAAASKPAISAGKFILSGVFTIITLFITIVPFYRMLTGMERFGQLASLGLILLQFAIVIIVLVDHHYGYTTVRYNSVMAFSLITHGFFLIFQFNAVSIVIVVIVVISYVCVLFFKAVSKAVQKKEFSLIENVEKNGDEHSLFELGNFYLTKKDKLNDAIDCFEKTLCINPEHAEAMASLELAKAKLKLHALKGDKS